MRTVKFILTLIGIMAAVSLFSINDNMEKDNRLLKSILDSVSVRALKNNSYIVNYKNKLDFSGKIDVEKRNLFLKAHPYLKIIKKGEKEIITNGKANGSFTEPNIHTINIEYYESTNLRTIGYLRDRIMPQIHSTIYDPYIFGIVLSPISSKGEKYYTFEITNTTSKNNVIYYTITFTPKFKSEKLSNGYMVISSDNWTVRNYHIYYKSLMFSLNNYITMGEAFTDKEYLPVEFDINPKIKFLGNRINGTTHTQIDYTEIDKRIRTKKKERHKNRDLSILINKGSDTTITKLLIDTTNIKNAPVSDIDTTGSKLTKNVIKTGKYLVKEYNFDLDKYGELQMHSLLSPILFDFSTSNGISYKQHLLYTKKFNNQTVLSLQPHLGYNFKHKELLGGIVGNFNYQPQRMGNIGLDINRGNTIKLDTLQYKSMHFRLSHNIEIANGLTLGTILGINSYTQKKNENTVVPPDGLPEYRSSFAEVDLTYTPGQYYHYKGLRKVYLHSRFPTFRLNYSYAFKGQDKKNIKIVSYQSIEFDVQQQINIGPLHKLSYRFGLGSFFNYSNLHLAEFEYLRKNNLPESWKDNNAGHFHLLTDINYNDIKKYVRLNLKYDAPFLLVPILFKHVPVVVNERLYYNMLFVPNMKPFVEIGYGIGTFIANVGLFWGGEITKMNKFGVKLTIELFNNN